MKLVQPANEVRRRARGITPRRALLLFALLSSPAQLHGARQQADWEGMALITGSMSYGGPTMGTGTGAIREGDLLIPTIGLGFGPLPAPTIRISTTDLGITPTGGCIAQPGVDCQVEVDAFSEGTDTLFPGTPGADDMTASVWFSVDEWAVGHSAAPGVATVLTEGGVVVADASADAFIDLGLGAPPLGPAAPVLTTGIVDGDGMVSASGALYPGFGFFEPNAPAMGAVDAGDDFDALDVGGAGGFPAGGVYFSLDSGFTDSAEGIPNTGSAAAQGFVGGDVIFTSAAMGTPMVYAAAATLGLDAMGADTDDLDALILGENGTPGFQPSMTPLDWNTAGTDMLIFSVRRDSAVIGTLDSLFGVAIEEGDLLTTPIGGGGAPAIFIAAENLGLATVRAAMPPVARGDDLTAADYAPLRSIDITSPARAFCFGDGTGSMCPCGNTGGAGLGCANGSGPGAGLAASGSAFASADDLVFAASGMPPNQPGLFFVGNTALNGGHGFAFGDGLRCVGIGVVRLGIKAADAGGNATWGPGLGALGGWAAGDTRRFQVWYRDPLGTLCGATFNLSSAREVFFLP